MGDVYTRKIGRGAPRQPARAPLRQRKLRQRDDALVNLGEDLDVLMAERAELQCQLSAAREEAAHATRAQRNMESLAAEREGLLSQRIELHRQLATVREEAAEAKRALHLAEEESAATRQELSAARASASHAKATAERLLLLEQEAHAGTRSALERAHAELRAQRRASENDVAAVRVLATKSVERARAHGLLVARSTDEAQLRPQGDAARELLATRHTASVAKAAAERSAQEVVALKVAEAVAQGKLERLERDVARHAAEAEDLKRRHDGRVEELESHLLRAQRKLARAREEIGWLEAALATEKQKAAVTALQLRASSEVMQLALADERSRRAKTEKKLRRLRGLTSDARLQAALAAHGVRLGEAGPHAPRSGHILDVNACGGAGTQRQARASSSPWHQSSHDDGPRSIMSCSFTGGVRTPAVHRTSAARDVSSESETATDEGTATDKRKDRARSDALSGGVCSLAALSGCRSMAPTPSSPMATSKQSDDTSQSATATICSNSALIVSSPPTTEPTRLALVEMASAHAPVAVARTSSPPAKVPTTSIPETLMAQAASPFSSPMSEPLTVPTAGPVPHACRPSERESPLTDMAACPTDHPSPATPPRNLPYEEVLAFSQRATCIDLTRIASPPKAELGRIPGTLVSEDESIEDCLSLSAYGSDSVPASCVSDRSHTDARNIMSESSVMDESKGADLLTPAIVAHPARASDMGMDAREMGTLSPETSSTWPPSGWPSGRSVERNRRRAVETPTTPEAASTPTLASRRMAQVHSMSIRELRRTAKMLSND